MQIPSIAPGKRYTLPRPLGSADALLLARHALGRQAAKQLTAIVTAEPADTQRLADELLFFAPGLKVAVFPDWETLPYDTFSPHQDLISERLATLWQVLQKEVDVLLLPATTALTRLAPPSFLAAYTFNFKHKQKLDDAALKRQLTLAGYQHVSQVVSPGEYAVRGGLIDLFPMGSLVPYRVDLFDDEVDSIRTFDPDTQRSLFPRARGAPAAGPGVSARRRRPRTLSQPLAREDGRRPEPLANLQGHGRGHRHRQASSTTCRCSSTRPPASSITSLRKLPWCCTARSTPRCSASGPTPASVTAFCSTTRSGPLLAPEEIFLTAEAFFSRANIQAVLAVRGAEPVDWARPLPDLAVDRHSQDPLRKLEQHLAQTEHRVLIVAESPGRRESLLELLRDHKLEPPAVDTLAAFEASDHRYAITVAPLATGFFWTEVERAGSAGIQFVTETRAVRSRPHPAQAPPPGADQRRRCADQRPLRAEGRRPGGACQPRHRPLRRPDQPRPGRRRRPFRSSCTSSTPTRPRSTCRWPSCS